MFNNHLFISGPKEFKLRKKSYKRTDFQLTNKRGLKLECSHFEPVIRPCEQLPCVIYLHGNSSSRLEALPSIDVLLPANITLFCFDFAGCGLSEGEYISLGWYEREDLEAVIDHLRKSNKISTIGLWGRSMGAATALMHANKDPSIAGLVLDSAFTDLKTLAEELCKQYASLPKLVVSGAMAIVRKTIQGKAKFDINHLCPINHVKEAFIPAFFVHGKDDDFVKPHHTQKLHDEYSGDKNFKMVEGDHNANRPVFLLDSIGIFFYNTLQVKYLVPDSEVKENKSQNQNENNGVEDYDGNLGMGFQRSAYNNISYKKIGNEEQIEMMMGDFDDDDLKKAIEESLKISDEYNKEKEKEKEDKEKKIGSKKSIEEKKMN